MKYNKIESMYKTFSDPLIKICLTIEEKNKAILISKILWVLLITEKDSVEEIYTELSKMISEHDAIISLGSVYYHKMKINLTKKEIKNLRKYYSNITNFNQLESWASNSEAKYH